MPDTTLPVPMGSALRQSNPGSRDRGLGRAVCLSGLLQSLRERKEEGGVGSPCRARAIFRRDHGAKNIRWAA
jgi:hypothetical protein